jgi:LL-diaminopimelate aminotransferase
MTGYRCGWVAGDPEAIDTFRRLKTNIDSGVPKFIQNGAVAALEDEAHVEAFRTEYRKNRDDLVRALHGAGLPRCSPQAGLFIWQKAPEGVSGLRLATRLLEPDLALITLPGAWLSESVQGQTENPGHAYIRIALVADSDRIAEATRRLGKVRLDRLL